MIRRQWRAAQREGNQEDEDFSIEGKTYADVFGMFFFYFQREKEVLLAVPMVRGVNTNVHVRIKTAKLKRKKQAPDKINADSGGGERAC